MDSFKDIDIPKNANGVKNDPNSTLPFPDVNGTNSKVEKFGESNNTFYVTVVAILISWVLVALWTRTAENFAYGWLSFDGSSFWHSLIISLVLMTFFLMSVWVIDQYALIPGTLENELEGNLAPGFTPSTDEADDEISLSVSNPNIGSPNLP